MGGDFLAGSVLEDSLDGFVKGFGITLGKGGEDENVSYRLTVEFWRKITGFFKVGSHVIQLIFLVESPTNPIVGICDSVLGDVRKIGKELTITLNHGAIFLFFPENPSAALIGKCGQDGFWFHCDEFFEVLER